MPVVPKRRGGLFAFQALRYIGWMAEDPKPLHVVSIFERGDDGKLAWRTLLPTRDEAEAQALHGSLVADGAKARIETIEPRKRRK